MRVVKGKDVKPGMVVRFDDCDVKIEMEVGEVDAGRLATALHSVGGSLFTVPCWMDIEVVQEAVPDEPTTPGARVKAGGRMYVLCDNDGMWWFCVAPDEVHCWNSWDDIVEYGDVIIVEADPSWDTPEDGKDEKPQQWDDIEEALRHNDVVYDCDGDEWSASGHGLYRRHGLPFDSSARVANQYAPFTATRN